MYMHVWEGMIAQNRSIMTWDVMNFKPGQHINQLDDPVNLTFELEMLK